jgi:hypothetical protein
VLASLKARLSWILLAAFMFMNGSQAHALARQILAVSGSVSAVIRSAGARQRVRPPCVVIRRAERVSKIAVAPAHLQHGADEPGLVEPDRPDDDDLIEAVAVEPVPLVARAEFSHATTLPASRAQNLQLERPPRV